jgi:hypothetical protein
VDHARKLAETDFRASWLFRAYGLDHDVYGLYSGIDKDIAFQDVLARMAQRNQLTLARIREQSPNLFPPSTNDAVETH